MESRSNARDYADFPDGSSKAGRRIKQVSQDAEKLNALSTRCDRIIKIYGNGKFHRLFPLLPEKSHLMPAVRAGYHRFFHA